MWAIPLLVALAFAQAFFLFPLVFESPAPAPADLSTPLKEVKVFLLSGGEVSLLLKTPLDSSGADRLDREELDRQLFPGDGGHHYYLLYAEDAGTEPLDLDLTADPLVLEGENGERWSPVDLAGALRERLPDLPDYLALQLRELVPDSGSLVIPAGARRRILLAYPAAASPERIARARTRDRVLVARVVPKDVLHDRLARSDGLFEPEER